MAATYRLAPLAEADLEDIWRYTAREWSVPQAISYTDSIIDLIEALAHGHATGAPVDVRPGYHRAHVGRHSVYYQHAADMVVVIRILHQSMDVGRHLQGRA